MALEHYHAGGICQDACASIESHQISWLKLNGKIILNFIDNRLIILFSHPSESY